MPDRWFDSHCPACDDLRPHLVQETDPGSCACTACGTVQQLMVPLG